jgi:hypothetical protein
MALLRFFVVLLSAALHKRAPHVDPSVCSLPAHMLLDDPLCTPRLLSALPTMISLQPFPACRPSITSRFSCKRTFNPHSSP